MSSHSSVLLALPLAVPALSAQVKQADTAINGHTVAPVRDFAGSLKCSCL